MCQCERGSITMLTEKSFYQCTIDERTKHRVTNPIISLPWAESMTTGFVVVVIVFAVAAVVVVVMRVLGTLTVTLWSTAPIGVPSENATISGSFLTSSTTLSART
jgi:hypothetical protein